jgi:GNAT superfamily N-acetyltransferase/predicted nucleic acid-binding protein
MRRVQFIIERDPNAQKELLPKIQQLADSEKEALGFLPSSAFGEAMGRGRLVAAIAKNGDVRTFAGFLLYSGVYPNVKIQQVAATPTFRRQGAASALMRALISELERLGFLSIRADVASDLPDALAFYAKHGFEKVRERPGGTTRGRTIIIHSRPLESDSLFSAAATNDKPAVHLSARRRNPSDVPMFVLDLNVYFDLVRDRNYSDHARRLFGEALGHTVRLVVADELVSELRRTSRCESDDPLLQMALQLPRLPKPDDTKLDALAASIHETVFVKTSHKDAGTIQAKSDAKHIAHAATAKAAAFVTRDGAILAARQELFLSFGIDIATVNEVLDLLPAEIRRSGFAPLQGEGFQPALITGSQLSEYFQEVNVAGATASEFTAAPSIKAVVFREAVVCEGRVVAAGTFVLPRSVDPLVRMLIHARHEHHDAELFADYLIESLIRHACKSGPIAIELVHLNGQSIVNRAARARRFHRKPGEPHFSKTAIGRPLTATTWSTAVQRIRRRTGLTLPDDLEAISKPGGFRVTSSDGTTHQLDAETLEDLLGPTIIVWPGREGVIVPIRKPYADELLGTSDQANFSFIHNKDASFLSKRAYINSPRSAKLMRPGSPIVFYESKRDGYGRGAAVAVARIVNSIVVAKSQVDPKSDRRLVIENAEEFSATEDVLLTTFDSLIPFARPVSLKKLKEFNSTGRANLVSAVSLSSDQMNSILDYGWSGD